MHIPLVAPATITNLSSSPEVIQEGGMVTITFNVQGRPVPTTSVLVGNVTVETLSDVGPHLVNVVNVTCSESGTVEVISSNVVNTEVQTRPFRILCKHVYTN